MDFKILPFELKSASGDGSTFAGYSNAFFNIDTAQEIVDKGAFLETLPEFMATGFIGGLNHNWDCPIGKPMSAQEDAKGLFVEGKISPTEHGKDCMVLLKDGVITKMSIGYRVLGAEMLDDAEAVANYWKDRGYTPSAKDIAAAQYGAKLLTKLHLYEFSPVTVPANSMADITRVKRYDADEIDNERDFEKFLRDAGFARAAAKTICVSGFKALRQRDVEEAPTEADEEKSEAPPTPDPPTEEPEATIEAKTEPVPTQEPALVVVEVVSCKKAPQSEVTALYADFLTFQAKRFA
jgi:HK97 family phage prohead protease